jgi:hypothetical protein
MSNKWDTQSDNGDTKVKVTTDYNRDGKAQTDAIVIDKATGQHIHVSADMKSGEVTERHPQR